MRAVATAAKGQYSPSVTIISSQFFSVSPSSGQKRSVLLNCSDALAVRDHSRFCMRDVK